MLFLALSQVSPTTSRCLSLKGLEDRKYNKFYPLSYNIELHSRGRNYGFDLKEEANCSPMVKSEFKISKWRLPNAKYAFDISSWCNVVYWRLRRKSRSKRLNEFFSSMTWGLVLLEWTTRSVLRQIYITLDEIVSNTLQIFSLSLSLSLSLFDLHTYQRPVDWLSHRSANRIVLVVIKIQGKRLSKGNRAETRYSQRRRIYPTRYLGFTRFSKLESDPFECLNKYA